MIRNSLWWSENLPPHWETVPLPRWDPQYIPVERGYEDLDVALDSGTVVELLDVAHVEEIIVLHPVTTWNTKNSEIQRQNVNTESYQQDCENLRIWCERLLYIQGTVNTYFFGREDVNTYFLESDVNTYFLDREICTLTLYMGRCEHLDFGQQDVNTYFLGSEL